MIGDDGLLSDAFNAFATVGLGLIAWLMNRSINRLDKDSEKSAERHEAAAKERAEIKQDIANFKLDVATNYAKESTVQASLSRIHDRIDEGQKRNEENFDDLRDDIKTLIGKVGK